MFRTWMLEDLVAAFNAHDLDRVMEFFIHDCVLEMPLGSESWAHASAERRRA